jgi:RepB DNA-primase from phage plasmid
LKKPAESFETANRYIRDNYEADDRLAIVLKNTQSGQTIQRLSQAGKIASPDFQAWLRHMNARRMEVYISMNSLKPQATGRTKADVAAIRHVYLDFDHDGTSAVHKMLRRDDVPQPNYILNTSSDKWQVVWKVDGFEKRTAESLQRNLVAETEADPAATDCNRVLRVPGFYNHKYRPAHYVSVQAVSLAIYRPEHFQKFLSEERASRPVRSMQASLPQRNPGAPISQSERDWAFAKRALARGDAPEQVTAAIAEYRRNDKPNPQYYAEHTVHNASEALAAEKDPHPREQVRDR